MYKVPHELDWTNCTFVIDMLNYTWTVSSQSWQRSSEQAVGLLAIHHFECRRRLKKAVQSEDQKSQRVSYILRNTKEIGEMSISWHVPFWKKRLFKFSNSSLHRPPYTSSVTFPRKLITFPNQVVMYTFKKRVSPQNAEPLVHNSL